MQQVRVKGPASYFPSIESRYGRPIDFWFATLGKLRGMKHMEMVNWLKSEHQLGHGHANAIVAHYLATTQPAGGAGSGTKKA